jgi:hypothetical protein
MFIYLYSLEGRGNIDNHDLYSLEERGNIDNQILLKNSRFSDFPIYDV